MMAAARAIAMAIAMGGDDNNDNNNRGGRRVMGHRVWGRHQAGDGPPVVGQAPGSQRQQK